MVKLVFEDKEKPNQKKQHRKMVQLARHEYMCKNNNHKLVTLAK